MITESHPVTPGTCSRILCDWCVTGSQLIIQQSLQRLLEVSDSSLWGCGQFAEWHEHFFSGLNDDDDDNNDDADDVEESTDRGKKKTWMAIAPQPPFAAPDDDGHDHDYDDQDDDYVRDRRQSLPNHRSQHLMMMVMIMIMMIKMMIM